MTRELPEGSVYNRIDDFQGPWRNRSHTDRKLENEWQQSALNNLMQYASSSGLGTWDPQTVDTNYGTAWRDRSHTDRKIENEWQQSKIADLEKWAADAYGDVAYNPLDTSPYGTAWRDRSHTDRKIENEMQQAAITNLQNWLVDVGKHQEQTAADARAALAPAIPDTDKFALQEIDLSKYLTKDELAKHESDWAAKHQADLEASKNQWAAESAAALQQAQTSWADQYAASLQQAKSDWSKEFASAEQQWAETTAKEQQDIRSSLLEDFKTQTAAKDRVHESQIDELKMMYSEQESDWKDQMNLYKTTLADAKSSWDTQMGQYEDTISGLGTSLSDAISEIGGLSSTIKDQQATIGEVEAARDELGGQVKAYQEQAIQDAERARLAASYGSAGKPMNQSVKGVKTKNELPSSKPKFKSSFFNRGGDRIKNTSLNIA